MLHEQLPIQVLHPLIARPFDYKHFTYPWHFHDEYEIIYIRESVGEWFVADSMGTFKPGDLFVLGANVPHFLRSAPEYFKPETTERVTGTIIQFEAHFMAHAIENYAELLPVKSLLERSKLGILYNNVSVYELDQMVESIPFLCSMDRIAAVLQLLVAISQNSGRQLGSHTFTQTHNSFKGTRMEKIQTYLQHHYTEPVDLAKVSSFAAMSPSAFCRYFKEKSGKTLTEYVMTLRVGYAKRLLIANKDSISTIALTCGFNSLSGFNSTFKEQVGLTPTAFRRKYIG